MKKLLLVLLAASIFMSCGKEEVAPDTTYLSAYKSIKFYNTSPVFMFTSNGEVMNQARVNAFAKRHSNWYFLENKEEAADTEYYIRMLSAVEAESSQNGVVARFDVHQDGDMQVFTAKTERTVTVPTRFGDVQYAVSKYKPVVMDKQDLASGNGYTYKTRSRLYGEIKGNELQLPRIFITLKTASGSVITSAMANVFDPTGVAELQPGDTLIVQSFINATVKQ